MPVSVVSASTFSSLSLHRLRLRLVRLASAGKAAKPSCRGHQAHAGEAPCRTSLYN